MKSNLFKTFVFAVILFNYSVVTAQDMTLDWAKAMGGTSEDRGSSICTTVGGYTYTTGYFYGTVDFNPSPTGTYNLTSAGSYDIFIQKLDPEGNFVWAKRIGGSDDDRGYSIFVDGTSVIITGFFNGTVDFDPSSATFNLTSAGGSDIFIQKLSSTGSFVWAKRMGGSAYDEGKSIRMDDDGNIYCTGFFRETADFDPSSNTYNLTSAGGSDIFILKLTNSGDLIWAKRMGKDYDDKGYSISTDTSGNVYTTGFFQRTVDFDPSSGTYNLTSAGSSDIFIQKLNTNGDLIWAKAMGGTNNDKGYSISTDASGNVYTTGSFEETVDFNPSSGTYNLTSAGYDDIFIQKLNTNGNLVWAKRMGGIYGDVGYSISTDAAGNSYTTGSFEGTADFDPSAGTSYLTSAGQFDIFIQKLDASGNRVWAERMGGTDYDLGLSISTNASGKICITGSFEGTADFNPSAATTNLTSAGGKDIFVAKYTQPGLGVDDFSTSGISIYPNPTNGKMIIDNGQLIIKNIEITDLTGKTVKTFSNFQMKQFSNFEIDLSNIVNGMYFLSMQTDKELFTTKIVKE